MKNTKNVTRKKIFGTAVFALFALSVALSASSIVQALFIDSGTTVIVDGTVSNIGTDRITISVVGSPYVITMDIDSSTVFSPSGFSPIGGDLVRVTAKKGIGNSLALLVQPVGNDPGYGIPGNGVSIDSAFVAQKTGDTFTVNTGSTMITFKVKDYTIFEGSNFASLNLGDEVEVDGVETTEFIALFVVIK